MYVKGCRSTWTAASIKENNSHPCPPQGVSQIQPLSSDTSSYFCSGLGLCAPYIQYVCVFSSVLDFVCDLWSLSKYQGFEPLSRLNVIAIDQLFQLK